MIESAFIKILEAKKEDLETHFVYAGYYYLYHSNNLKSFLLKGMKKHHIKMVMVTNIHMTRERLITKKDEKNYRNDKKYGPESVNDDLESVFQDLQLRSKRDKHVSQKETYFLPHLNEKELTLVEQDDSNYFKTSELVLTEHC